MAISMPRLMLISKFQVRAITLQCDCVDFADNSGNISGLVCRGIIYPSYGPGLYRRKTFGIRVRILGALQSSV